MTASRWTRQIHRWASMGFVLAVVGVFLAMSQGEPAEWVYFLPLPPLFVLMLTGLWLFAQPHLAKWRGLRVARA